MTKTVVLAGKSKRAGEVRAGMSRAISNITFEPQTKISKLYIIYSR